MIIIIFEDENFADSQTNLKSTKIVSLENLYVYDACLVCHNIARFVLTE